MTSAAVLYRSVSIPELRDIRRSGKIMGGGNAFNPADDRTHVFFGDELNELLISQGEDLVRQARRQMMTDPQELEWAAIQARIERLARAIVRRLDRDRIRYPRSYAEEFASGEEVRRFRSAAFRYVRCNRRKYSRLFRAMSRLKVQRRLAEERSSERFTVMLRELQRCAAAAPYSSAVLVTKPITGGFMYSAETGNCGLGEREFGFRPGQITIRDVAVVMLVKAGAFVGRCEPQGAALAKSSC